MITLKNFHYKQSEPGYLKQGVKGNKVPKGAVGGKNGSYIMAGEPPKIIFEVKENGIESFIDFYPLIKLNSSRKITKKYCKGIYDKVSEKEYKSLKQLNKAIISYCK